MNALGVQNTDLTWHKTYNNSFKSPIIRYICMKYKSEMSL